MAFTSLTTRDLNAQNAHLDLSALHALRVLEDLRLWEGTFTVGGLAANIACLVLQDAHVICSQGLEAVGELQLMDLLDSTLDGIYA